MPKFGIMAEDPKPAGPVAIRIPEGDTKPRLVCESCGFINYVNPRIVVGAVSRWQDKILLCRRAIEPRRKFWTIPAGYLEVNESATDGARREAREEAKANIEITALLAVYSILRISQVQLIYRARLRSPEVAPGIESLEAKLFAWRDIPWDDLAFPSVHWALYHYREVAKLREFAPRGNPPGASGDFYADGGWSIVDPGGIA